MSRITSLTRFAMVLLLAALPLAGAAVLPAPSAHAQDGSGDEQTKPITNHGKGTTTDATVRVSKTKNLFDREQVTVNLSGFTPSWNAYSTATYGKGEWIEYPVVVMQCRGDNPDRSACLTRDRIQWHAGFDVDATPEQRAVASSQGFPDDISPYEGSDQFEKYQKMFRAERLPFVSVDDVSYLWVEVSRRPDGQPDINDPTLKSFPPPDVTAEGAATVNARAVPIRTDGTNEFLFEVRRKNTQPSLGCSDTEKCSLVVVPVMDMACVEELPGDKPLPTAAAGCGGDPMGLAPEIPSGFEEPNPFLVSQQWLAESNWANRFVIPLSFAPDLESCDVRDNQVELAAFGSELVDVAQESWGAAYCTGARSSDYLPRYTVGSEYYARRQITTKLGEKYQQDAVFVTQPVTESPRPVAHAPTAVTGFAVAFAVDDGRGRQVRNLTLSPRLLAKLITQSYAPVVLPADVREGRQIYDGTQPISNRATANKYYVSHPDLLDNPGSLFLDPEFVDLNPDFEPSTEGGGAATHLLRTLNPSMFTIDSDVTMDVTRYVTSDPAARAWLDGQPDQYGMRVNPRWRNLQPTQIYTLLDTWVRPASPKDPVNWKETNPDSNRYTVRGAGDTCDEVHRTPYLVKLANVANSAKAAADHLLNRRGTATPACRVTQTPIPDDQQAPAPEFPGDDVARNVRYDEKTADPADYGKRAQLAVTTVPRARLYALPTAKLVNAGGKAVAPTDGTMVNALNAAVQDPVTGTVQIDHTKMTGDDWYPGAMASFLAVPTSGLDLTTGARYADYIEFMVTTGQVPGTTLANLPPGYDPLPPAMVQYALEVAAAVRAQRGEVPAPPPGGPLSNGLPSDLGGRPAAAGNPGNGLAVSPASADEKVDGDPENVARTEGASSWLARWAIPLLIGFGLLAALVAFVVQVSSQPDHPVRRWLGGLLQAVGRR